MGSGILQGEFLPCAQPESAKVSSAQDLLSSILTRSMITEGNINANNDVQDTLNMCHFNQEETKVLSQLYRRLTLTGGPIDRSRFIEIIQAASPQPIEDVEILDTLFRSCDHDKDGKIDQEEWLTILTVLMRIDPPDSVKDIIVSDLESHVATHASVETVVSNKTVKVQSSTTSRRQVVDLKPLVPIPNKTTPTKNTPQKQKPPIKPKSNKKPTKSRTKPKSKIQKPPPPPPPGPDPYFSEYLLAKHSLQLERTKTAAFQRMKDLISDKYEFSELWQAVKSDSDLLNAWAIKSFSTAKLMQSTKAVAAIHRMGHKTGPRYVKPGSDDPVVEKYDRISNGVIYKRPVRSRT